MMHTCIRYRDTYIVGMMCVIINRTHKYCAGKRVLLRYFIFGMCVCVCVTYMYTFYIV